MTIFLPLETGTQLPSSPAFLTLSPDPADHMRRVIDAVLKARRIAVVCGMCAGLHVQPLTHSLKMLNAGFAGAGISVQAGIPDFRSSAGLFHTLKEDHPRLSSGRDLFDGSVFNVSLSTSIDGVGVADLSATAGCSSIQFAWRDMSRCSSLHTRPPLWAQSAKFLTLVYTMR